MCIDVQVIRGHRLEREADYAAQREQEWERALEQEAHRHRCAPCCSCSCLETTMANTLAELLVACLHVSAEQALLCMCITPPQGMSVCLHRPTFQSASSVVT